MFYCPILVYLLSSSVGLSFYFSAFIKCTNLFTSLSYCPHPWLLTVSICWTDCLSASLSAYNLPRCSLHCHSVPILGYLLSSSAGLTVHLLFCLHTIPTCSLHCLTVPILVYLLSSSVGLTVCLFLCLHTMYQHVHFTVLLSPSLVTHCHHLLD